MEYTLKQISKITGKSNTALFKFINKNSEFVKKHSQKNGRFVKYDEEALNLFIDQFGEVCEQEKQIDCFKEMQNEQINKDLISCDSKKINDSRDVEKKERKSIVEAFEEQIESLKKECEELTFKLEEREKDCAEWRFQAGQALNALSKEQERVVRLEERLAGYLPASRTQYDENIVENSKKTERKLLFKERIKILFGIKT